MGEPDDLSDLPPELVAELSGRKADTIEVALLSVIGNKPMNIDEILIAVWRTHGIVLKRRYTMNKLYRMRLDGMLYSVAGQKVAYVLTKIGAKP